MKKRIYIFILISLHLISCKKFLDIAPPATNLTSESVYQEDVSAIGVMNGIYAGIAGSGIFTGPEDGMSVKLGLTADEYGLLPVSWNPVPSLIYKNEFSETIGPGFWSEIYRKVNGLNTAIDGISASKTLSDGVKKQLIGEARFLRAVYFFYLTNMFKDAPMPLSGDYRLNDKLPSAGQEKIYDQVLDDLQNAEELLSPGFLNRSLSEETDERIRPAKPAAQAMLARVYLYLENWEMAESYASMVIGNNKLFDTVGVNEVFKRNSREAIWQLQPAPGYNTRDGEYFIVRDMPNSDHPIYLSSDLLSDFNQQDDRRYDAWVGTVTAEGIVYHFPYKYKRTYAESTLDEYLMVLRLGEQYLIRAEARLREGNIAGALEDLNVIRKRAGLGDNVSLNADNILADIILQRRLELFSEHGHRWFDLKRLGLIDSVMDKVMPTKGGRWESYKQYFPIMLAEIQKNPNIKQNEGY